MEVSGGSFKAGIPKTLFATRIVAVAYAYEQYDVSANGQRFLINARLEGAVQPVTLYTNWVETLKKKR